MEIKFCPKVGGGGGGGGITASEYGISTCLSTSSPVRDLFAAVLLNSKVYFLPCKS